MQELFLNSEAFYEMCGANDEFQISKISMCRKNQSSCYSLRELQSVISN